MAGYALEGPKWAADTITWSFAASTYAADTANGDGFSAPITDAAEQAVVEAAVAGWQGVSGLHFVQVPDGTTAANAADIRIGFADLGLRAGSSGEVGSTAYQDTFPVGNEAAATFSPDVVIRLQDPAADPLATDGSGQLAYGGAELYQVVLHELGHALGLAHDTANPAAVMYPVASAANRDLSADDIAGIQALYGAPTTVTNATAPAYQVRGTHGQYAIAPTGAGGFMVQDSVPGRDGTTAVAAGVRQVAFADGTGMLDATGNAEDVARLYLAAFNRDPDGSGLQFWAAQIDSGQATLGGVAEAFAASAEFGADHAGQSDSAYVDSLYAGILGRAADAAGAAYWAGALDSGTLDRGQVLQFIAGSAEDVQHNLGIAGSQNYGEAYRAYQAALGRTPDGAGLAYWEDQLSQGLAPTQMAQGFVGSAEFTSRYGALDNAGFVAQLYQNVLGRAPDANGDSFWIAQLNGGGATRAQVLLGFSDSAENRLNTAAATHDGWVFVPA